MNPEKVSVGPFHLPKASSRKYEMLCRAPELWLSGNFCRSRASLSPAVCMLEELGWIRMHLSRHSCLLCGSHRAPWLQFLCTMEWKAGKRLCLCDLRIEVSDLLVVQQCPLPARVLRPWSRPLDKCLRLGGCKGKERLVLCRTLKPLITGMNLDIFSQERNFRGLASGRRQRDNLCCPEKKADSL